MKMLVDFVCENFGNEHPYSCEALSLLAASKYNIGDYDAAIFYMNKAIGIAKKMNWDYRNLLHDLAYFQYGSGDHVGAFDNFIIGFEFLKNKTISSYHWMTLNERSAFNDYYRGNIDDFPRLAAITPDDARYAVLAYDALLFNKGLLLNSSIQLFRTLDKIDDKETKKLISEWRNVNHQILVVENSGKDVPNDLIKEADRIEKQLIERSMDFEDYTKNLALTYKDVQSKLGINDVAIELCSHRKDSGAKEYGALILTKQENPVYVVLGSDSEWGINDLSDEEFMGETVFDKVLGNLKPFLPAKDKGVAYFAPDGIFHKVPIENLPGSEGYRLRRLSSTRELALTVDHSSSVSSMALFGGVQYGLGEVASFYSDVKKGKRASSVFLDYLPGALDEVNVIKETLDGRIKIDLKTGKDATKTNFMKFSRKKPSLIHIATHGFFYDTSIENDKEKDPLTNAGLYFAGAQNSLWSMDTNKMKDNGILTAAEISYLDLRGVNLAVLSACNTG